MHPLVKKVLKPPYLLAVAIHDKCLFAFTGSRLTANFAYGLLSSAFGREHLGVLYGRKKYRQNKLSRSGNSPTLRRNVHRLEKGISMPNRRTTFALDYIEETVEQFAKITASGAGDAEELKWAGDVLTQYFQLVSASPLIDRLAQRFRSVHAAAQEVPDNVPHRRGPPKECPVSYEAFLELSHRRESVRWFLPKPVDRNLVDQALLAGIQAPSACNRQPYRFIFLDNPADTEAVANIPGGAVGFQTGIPLLAVVVGQLRAFEFERDRHLIYIDASLAIMGFLLALETLDLSSCTMNFSDVEAREKKLQKRLNLDIDERPIMLIAIGHPLPDGMVPHSAKKTIDTIRTWQS
jgi:nitroreductase